MQKEHKKFYILGNWKMQVRGTTAQELLVKTATLVASENFSPHLHVSVFPPFTYLDRARYVLAESPAYLGAQNVSSEMSGALTGQISILDLQDLGVFYALLGHAEVRALLHETDAGVAKKAALCSDVGIVPVVCFGADVTKTPAQHAECILKMSEGVRKMILAYEPIGAIGTGVTPSLEHVVDVVEGAHELLDRYKIAGEVVYGGSVNAENIESFMSTSVDGVLVGGSSHTAKVWTDLMMRANKFMQR
ncbi:MAG: triose-phosphate isomerase [Alphaproteobacteria bacterium]|nr:triose-phosphate isomerase [Alphaproteobacteria bacterium]